jgi:hypothetical protein
MTFQAKMLAKPLLEPWYNTLHVSRDSNYITFIVRVWRVPACDGTSRNTKYSISPLPPPQDMAYSCEKVTDFMARTSML